VISNNPTIKGIQAQIEVLPDRIVSSVKKYGRTYIQLTDPCLDDDKLISVGDYWIVSDPDDNYIWDDAYEGTFEDFYNLHNSGTASGYKDIYCWDGNKWVHVFDTALVGEAYSRVTQTAELLETEVRRVNAIEGTLYSRISQTADEIQTEVSRATEQEGLLNSKISQTATNIHMQVSALKTGDYQLQSNINMTATNIALEVSARESQGRTLQSAINMTATSIALEVSARKSGDTTREEVRGHDASIGDQYDGNEHSYESYGINDI